MKVLTPHEFLGFVWPKMPLLTHETLELRVIHKKTKEIKRFFFRSKKEFLIKAEEYGEDYNIYFGVSTRFRAGGKKKDCYRSQCVWADFDRGKKIQDCLDFKPKPNILVNSGGGVHAYWILDSPALLIGERWEEFEKVNRGISQKFDSDETTIDSTRILRIPSFFNFKYSPPKEVKAFLNEDVVPYKLSDFKKNGLYIDKPSQETEDIETTGKVIKNLSLRIRTMLTQTGNSSHDGDRSRQDSAVITAMLSSGISPEDVYATFAASKRGKSAAERHPHFDDYLTRTIQRASGFIKNEEHTPQGSITLDFGRRKETKTSEDGIISEKASSIEAEKVHWLWKGYIPAGKLTIIVGDPGMGKSTLGIDILARVSQGTKLPTGERAAPGTCLIASAEDAAEDTLLPRLIAAKAKLSRTEIIRRVVIDGEEGFLTFPRDLEFLRNLFIKKGARIFILDPFNAFVERGTDTYKDQDVRVIMSGMESIANETGTAIVIVTHPTKKEDASALYRVSGSIGFTGAARSVLQVTKTDKMRVLHSLKSNLEKEPSAISYEIQKIRRVRQSDREWLGEEQIISSGIRWKGKVAFDPKNGSATSHNKAALEAETFLKQLLEDGGSMSVDQIKIESKNAGVRYSELQTVKTNLGIIPRQQRDGKWYWKLSD